MSQMRIFLSHSSQDKALADALVRALRQAGSDVWYDEHNLHTGQLLEEIQREIRTRPVFIVVLSKAAFHSEWVREECRWAWGLRIRQTETRTILPVAAEPVQVSDFDNMLFLEQYRRIEGHTHADVIEGCLSALKLVSPSQSSKVYGLVVDARVLTIGQLYTDAIPLLEEAVQLAPNHFVALFALGYNHLMLRHSVAGLSAYERARHAEHHLGARLRESKEARDMLDLEAIGQRLTELDQTGREVLAEDRQTDHRLFWTGMEATGHNLERLYRLGMGAELDARLAALEQRSKEGGTDDAECARA